MENIYNAPNKNQTGKLKRTSSGHKPTIKNTSENETDTPVSTNNRMVSPIKPSPCINSKIRTPKRILHQIAPPETPECYNTVTFETPRKESTKNKAGKASKINVAVRVRPMNSQELDTHKSTNIIATNETEIEVRVPSINDPTSEFKHCFQYDHVLQSNGSNGDQRSVYEMVARPLLNEAFEGYNACLFAYGQTGSGKSYSMMGIEDPVLNSCFTGIIPRFCHELFLRLEKLDPTVNTAVEVSYFEIYNEKIHDLLASPGAANKTPLKVREHPVLGPYVVDLSVHPVDSYDAINSWIVAGNKRRATASTSMNDKSSRSHSIFSVILSISTPNDGNDAISRRSKVNLVDLAGSERVGNAQNEERLRQGVSINRSLLTLGKVIAALSEQKRVNHIPYRESVLTWLLRESLGGNSRTCMLATISPASCHLEETLSTLRYASQARTIVNRIRINEDPHDRLIKELRDEVRRLRTLRLDYEKHSGAPSDDNDTNSSDLHKSSLDMSEPSSQDCKIMFQNGRTHIEIIENSTSKENFVLGEGENITIKGKFMIVEKCTNVSDVSNTLTDSADANEFETEMMNLDNSIIVAEQYRSQLDLKTKICSTPDAPNDVSSFHTNFLEELENILSSVKSPRTPLTLSQKLHNRQKSCFKSTFNNREHVEKCLDNLKEARNALSSFAVNDRTVDALLCLDDAIYKVNCAFKITKSQKTVKFKTPN